MAQSIRRTATTVLLAALSGIFGAHCDCAGGKTIVVERTRYVSVPNYVPAACRL